MTRRSVAARQAGRQARREELREVLADRGGDALGRPHVCPPEPVAGKPLGYDGSDGWLDENLGPGVARPVRLDEGRL